jgi:anti-anti-sigma factor
MNRVDFDPALQCEIVGSNGNVCEVRVAGTADLASAAALADLEANLRDYTFVALDVAELECADTTFLRFLLRLRSAPDRQVKLVRVSRRLQRLLDVTGLSALFA